MRPLSIEVFGDFTSPWCWIAERRLHQALDEAGALQQAQLHYRPFLQNPSIQPQGIERRYYCTAKAGSWARAQLLDAQVSAAGQEQGLEFRFDRISTVPQTLAAHLLVWQTQQSAPAKTSALVEAIYHGYFHLGLDIGKHQVLADIAASVGLDAKACLNALNKAQGLSELRVLLAESRKPSIDKVPLVDIDGHRVTGAQPISVFRRAITRSPL